MRKIYIIAIILALILFIVISFALVIDAVKTNTNRKEKQLQLQEVANQHVIDSLRDRHTAELLLAQQYAWSLKQERDSLVAIINSRISKTKIAYDKELDHVALLAPDSLLMLVSGQLRRQRK